MSKNIPLHPKYGLNHTIPVCFWCGKEKNQIAFLGNKYKGEAPRKMVVDYEPCDSCEASMAQGITVIECKHEANNFAEAEPTSRWAVVTEDCIRRLVDDTSMADDIVKAGKLLMSVQNYEAIGFHKFIVEGGDN